MDRLHAVAQHMLNLCGRFNDELQKGGYDALTNYYHGKIRTAVNMAFTCGYSVSVLTDPFLDNVVAVKVWDLETDEYLIKGIRPMYSKIYRYDYWNIFYEKLPNYAASKRAK